MRYFNGIFFPTKVGLHCDFTSFLLLMDVNEWMSYECLDESIFHSFTPVNSIGKLER
jgi:hypothetical protein